MSDGLCVYGVAMTLAYLRKVFGRHAYCASEEMPVGYRLVIGFDTLEQVQDAHEAIVLLGKALESSTSQSDSSVDTDA